MELNLRTVLVILGALLMLGILLDGFRRMRRARQEALKLDVKGDFKFPEDSFSSELPNGGGRVIGGHNSDQLEHEAFRDEELLNDQLLETEVQQFKDQLHDLSGMSALDQQEEDDRKHLDPSIQESLHEERIYAGEPDFQHESYDLEPSTIPDNGELSKESDGRDFEGSLQKPLEEASKENSQVSSEKNSDDDLKHSPSEVNYSSDSVVGSNSEDAFNESSIKVDKTPVSEHLVPKAKPLNLDEHVPLLMDVEELGEELAPQDNNVSDAVELSQEASSNNQNDIGSTVEETIELTVDDLPGIEASVSGISEILAPELIADTEKNLEEEPFIEGRQEAEDMMAIAAYTPVKKPGLNAECLAERAVPSLVLVTHVVPHDEDGFCGEDILYLVNSCDLRHGEKDIFHRFEKEGGEGRIQFSMANSFNPGTFNPETLLHERIHGVSLFMSLPGPEKAMDAFEAMTEMASVIGRNLGGDVHDETHSIMALQTIEHNRQQVRDFVRKQKLMGKK